MKLLQTVRGTPLEKRILLTCFSAGMVAGISSQMLGVILPNIRESCGLSYETSGLLISAQSVGTMTANIVSGLLPLFLGRRHSVMALTCWLAVGAALLIFTGNPILLMAAGFMIGISRGGNVNFGNVMVGIYAEDKAACLNLYHGCFAIGALCAPFVAVAFSALGFWKGAVAIIGILGLWQFLLYLTLKLPPDMGKRHSVPAEPSKAQEKSLYLRSRRFWLAGFILVFYIATEYGISGWLVTYFKESGLLSGVIAQFMSSLLWADILVGRLVSAALGSRIPRHRLLVVNGVGFVAFLLLLLFSTSMPLIVAGIMGFGFFMAGIYPGTLAGVNREIGGSDLAMSILVTMGGIGGIVMPAAIGFVSERVGLFGGMSLLLAVAVITLGLILYNGWLARSVKE